MDSFPNMFCFSKEQKSNDTFTLFEELPHDVQLEIVKRSNNLQLSRVNKELHSLISITNAVISLHEFKSYIRDISTKVNISVVKILKDFQDEYNVTREKYQLNPTPHGEIYLCEDINILEFKKYDLVIEYIMESNDKLVNVLFDPITVNNIIFRRKNLDSQYAKKFTYSYVETILSYFKDYHELIVFYILACGCKLTRENYLLVRQITPGIPNDTVKTFTKIHESVLQLHERVNIPFLQSLQSLK